MREFVFEVPVYRVSIEEVIKEGDAHVARHLEAYTNAWRESGREPSSKELESARRRFAVSYGGGPYPYNEAVGWIRVVADGQILKAYGYRVPQSRVVRGFMYLTTAHTRYWSST